MLKASFIAQGHKNVIGEHDTTLELTTEDSLTRRGTCIIGVSTNLALADLSPEIKQAAMSEVTIIELEMTVKGFTEIVTGTGAKGLSYSDNTSMVVRTSTYQCGRTLMIQADKAASDLNRSFIEALQDSSSILQCDLTFR